MKKKKKKKKKKKDKDEGEKSEWQRRNIIVLTCPTRSTYDKYSQPLPPPYHSTLFSSAAMGLLRLSLNMYIQSGAVWTLDTAEIRGKKRRRKKVVFYKTSE